MIRITFYNYAPLNKIQIRLGRSLYYSWLYNYTFLVIPQNLGVKIVIHCQLKNLRYQISIDSMILCKKILEQVNNHFEVVGEHVLDGLVARGRGALDKIL